MNGLRQLAHPMVRDLAWAVFSDDLMLASTIDPGRPALRACALSVLTEERLAWLRALDREPQPLLKAVGPRAGRRLGLYFEALWHFFLDCEPSVELLAHNLPVREAGRTVGEFDCLYRCRDSGDTVHLELAVKFYLYTGPGSGATGDDRADWLGPGRRDRLDRKLSHLARQQTRLADDPAAQRLVAARGLTPDRVEVVVKGRLFRRPGQPCLPPTGFNPLQTLQLWDDVDTLAASPVAESAGHGHVILSRQHWFAPLIRAFTMHPASLPGETAPGPLYTDTASLATSLRNDFAAGGGPRLVAAIDRDGAETQRFFATPAGWPR